MKSPNVNETQSVAKVVYAINNASSVVCIFSSRLINTFKRAVEKNFVWITIIRVTIINTKP